MRQTNLSSTESYPGPRDFLLQRREKREKSEKEAERENLWLQVMQISLSCYDTVGVNYTSQDRLTSNQ